jgi:hypothetical protein
MNRKDFLDCMMELRNKGKTMTENATTEIGQKVTPEFSKFSESDRDVTSVRRWFRFPREMLFRHFVVMMQTHPQP